MPSATRWPGPPGCRPDVHRDYRRAAWRQLRTEPAGASQVELWRYTADMLYLIEDPHRPAHDLPAERGLLRGRACASEDGPTIGGLTDTHGGRESAELLGRW